MSISSRISSMEEHVTNAYNGLQGLGADLTDVNKNIENISMVLDDIYDSMPQVSGEGTSLTLDDTRVGKIKSTLKGNTSQTGTPTPSSPIPVNVVSGDNEINVCGKNITNWIQGNVNAQGQYVSSTTSVCTDFIKVNYNDTFTASKKTLFDSSTNDNMMCRMFDKDKNILGSIQALGRNQYSNSFTINNVNCEYAKFAQFKSDGILVSNSYELMVEKGSSASTYEPYQGNTYNIDLPVENLFDKNSVEILDAYYISGTTGDLVSGGTSSATSTYIEVEPNTTYTLTNNNMSKIVEYNSSKGFVLNNTTNLQTFTTQPTTKYIRFQFLTSTKDVDIIQLELGSKANKYTPYGTTPIELAEISTYNDEIFRTSGKNLFNATTVVTGYLIENGTIYDTLNYNTSDYIPVEPNTAYYKTITNTPRTKFYDSDKQPLNTTTYQDISVGGSAGTFTTPNNAYYVRMSYRVADVDVNSIQVEKGTTATEYNPYGTGEWYLKEDTKKLVLDGTQNITLANGTPRRFNATYTTLGITNIKEGSSSEDTTLNYRKCDHFIYSAGLTNWGRYYLYNSWLVLFDNNSVMANAEALKTWLSNNNTTIRYALATPTYTKITSSNYPTLYSQLEAIYNAQGYDNQTNISQINNDLPFKITASALKKWSE